MICSENSCHITITLKLLWLVEKIFTHMSRDDDLSINSIITLVE